MSHVCPNCNRTITPFCKVVDGNCLKCGKKLPTAIMESRAQKRTTMTPDMALKLRRGDKVKLLPTRTERVVEIVFYDSITKTTRVNFQDGYECYPGDILLEGSVS